MVMHMLSVSELHHIDWKHILCLVKSQILVCTHAHAPWLFVLSKVYQLLK
jgi:hypothetical protein